jgi:prepilin-type N-terminal cleavage/methylation domain-containing protein
MKRRGFTLTEVMIGLGLALFVVVAAFEFFGVTRALFAKLRVEETDTQSAEAALDKIRIDFRRAGTGLVGAMRASTVAGVEAGGGSLCVAIAERSYGLAQDLVPGQTRVPLTTTADLSAGREVCLTENGRAEIHAVAAVESAAAVLDGPLQQPYSMAGAQFQLIEKVAYYFDGPSGILRRKVNDGSPQPLLEDVESADFGYDPATNLARAAFALEGQKEKRYETTVFPKNVGLARPGS